MKYPTKVANLKLWDITTRWDGVRIALHPSRGDGSSSSRNDRHGPKEVKSPLLAFGAGSLAGSRTQLSSSLYFKHQHVSALRIPSSFLNPIVYMASHDLGIPQITVVDVQDDINSTPLVNSSFPTSGPPIRHRSSPSDTHDFLPPSTLRLTNRQPFSLSSRTSDGSSSHPPSSPTQSTRSHSSGSTVVRSRNNNPEEHDGLSSSGQLAPPTRGHFPMGCTVAVSSIGTDRDINGSLSLGLSSSIDSFLKSDVPCVFTLRLVTTL